MIQLNKNDIYCIIVTYNAMKWMPQCLSHLKESDIKLNLVFVDNCSSDSTIDFIKENAPEAEVIINTKNKGFGYANNQGIEYAYKKGAQHFFLLNQDAYIDATTVENLIRIQDQYSIDLVSPIQYNGDGSILDQNYFENTVISCKNNRFVSDMLNKKLEDYYLIEHTPAAAWMLSRKVIETVGGFDPVFFHYGEDDNYRQRILYKGGKIAFVPSARVRHDRIYKGNIKAFNKYGTGSALIADYCRVDKQFFRLSILRIKLHLSLTKKVLCSLIKLNFSDAFQIAMIHFSIFCNLPQFYKHYKEDRKIGPHWLDLN